MAALGSCKQFPEDLHEDNCISMLYISSSGRLSSYPTCTEPRSIILQIASHSPWIPSQSMGTKYNEAILSHRFSYTSDCTSVKKVPKLCQQISNQLSHRKIKTSWSDINACSLHCSVSTHRSLTASCRTYPKWNVRPCPISSPIFSKLCSRTTIRNAK